MAKWLEKKTQVKILHVQWTWFAFLGVTHNRIRIRNVRIIYLNLTDNQNVPI